jgi:hypothetical protein
MVRVAAPWVPFFSHERQGEESLNDERVSLRQGEHRSGVAKVKLQKSKIGSRIHGFKGPPAWRATCVFSPYNLDKDFSSLDEAKRAVDSALMADGWILVGGLRKPI